jgi:hypothetical protein
VAEGRRRAVGEESGDGHVCGGEGLGVLEKERTGRQPSTVYRCLKGLLHEVFTFFGYSTQQNLKQLPKIEGAS